MLRSYVCPICEAETYNWNDVHLGYCPRCHAFTRACVFFCDGRPTVVFGNVAACQPHANELLP